MTQNAKATPPRGRTSVEPHAPDAPRPLPLAGIRVLDLTQVMAGPFATMLLGDLGADVVKIEPPGTGDQTRGAMGFKLKGNDSMGFLNLNRNKRSLVLNLKTKSGRAAFLRLVESADVVVENYRPGVAKKLGIDYETLAALNPRLIYACISGFGQTGPWSARPGFDLMAQAMSGVMSVTGYPDGPPVKAGVPVADLGSALYAVYGILSAYIGAKATGRGQMVDASLLESAMSFSIWDISEYWGTGRIPEPVGTGSRMSSPYQAVKAQDGYFVIGANNQKLWTQLCQEMDRPDLLEDLRFLTVTKRLQNLEVLIDELEKTFVTQSAETWVERLLAVGVPAGRMNSYPEAFASEHSRYRQMKIEIDHPVEGKIPNIGFAVKMHGTPQQVRRPPPLLGEHTDEILQDAGFGPAERDDMQQDGAFSP